MLIPKDPDYPCDLLIRVGVSRDPMINRVLIRDCSLADSSSLCGYLPVF